MNKADRLFFEQHGYVNLGKVIDGTELARWIGVFDRDRSKTGYCWRSYANHQTINCDGLVTSPELDELIRHPRVLEPIEELMGNPVCFSEICLRHMARHEGAPAQSWHRDRPHWAEHPLRMEYIQLMLYLSDVKPSTHCFSLSPESIDEPVLDREEQLNRGGVVDLHGVAGTATLFNIAVLHTATVRATEAERKTVQVYYGHRHRPYLSDDSAIPASLWRDCEDTETRAFYGNLNDRTRRYCAAFE